ncbi:calpastatin isoform X6 [Hippocampus comes]|uniref:calpastatin isoform X6 n=1 Tax=Hippocampus comes TaxID=109280 RepID=UPI00094E5190|nr:PREDICTED: calpastatin isoform X6 [Hippocampus comes]
MFNLFVSLCCRKQSRSQPSQATPKPAAQVSTVTPSQFEKASSGSNMATKPGGVTTTKGGTAGSTSITTAGQGVPRAKPQTNTKPTVIDMSSAGSTVVNMTLSGASGSPQMMSKTSPVSTLKSSTAATGTAAATAAANVAVSSSKGSPKDMAKVQVQVRPTPETIGPKETPEIDPFDALASILPPVDPVTPKQPIFTGPEVKERDATAEKAPKCGERDDTLPPDYRFENMAPPPADAIPKDVPKPLSTDEALESLSAGFMTSTVPTAPKMHQQKDTTDASSAAPCYVAPPLVKKVDIPAPAPYVAAQPPADKKAKMEVDNFSLEALIPPAQFQKTVCVGPPPTEKETLAEKASSDFSLKAELDTKPKTDEGGSMSLGALSALGDMLAAPEPKPEPKLRPEDMVSENKHKEEDAVRVGEREDSIAPEYRFNEEELKKLPAPKPQPTLNTNEALDLLSDDFLTSSTAPAQKAEVPAFVPTVSVCPAPPKPSQGGAMPLDALSALSDTLPVDAPKPEPPKLRPEEIISEKKHKEEEAVRVGEREDSIAPEYRFNEEELKKLPPPKPQPTLNTNEALDLLSGDFASSSAAPAQTKKTLSAQDLLTSTKSSAVHAPLPPLTRKAPQVSDCPPVLAPPAKPETDEGDSMSLDALSALGDTLAAPEPRPEPPKLRPEDIVLEDKHKEEDAVLVGEREDSIAPEYRFNEEELKKLPAPKPQPKMNTSEALDLLSGDFATSSAAPAVHAPVVSSSAAPAQSSADFALDALAGDFVSSSAAPTVKSAACVPTETASETQFSPGADSALDALSETLVTEITPAPQPAPIPAKDLVKEKKAVEERLIKMGERDDTLPPEYRPTEEDLKNMAEAKANAGATPKTLMDDKTALDLLSSDFNTSVSSSAAATAVVTPSALDSEALKQPMPRPVPETLADTLLPDDPAFKAKAGTAKSKSKSKSKSKKQHASEPPADKQLSGQQSSDVVPTSAQKGRKS